MQVRLAKQADVPRLRQIYQQGRQTQLDSGNLNQWPAGYPSIDLIESDLKLKALHVVYHEEGEEILGCYSLFNQPDPTYTQIEGAWLNDAPYYTIHRLAAARTGQGVASFILNHLQDQLENIRIDTHRDNAAMRHLLDKFNFIHCGVIYVNDGSQRQAYQWLKD